MRRWVPVALAAAASLVACGDTAEPQAVAEPTRWDPCSITPEQIGATGLDPDYRDVGWGEGIVVDDWAICSFRPGGVDVAYTFNVKSSLNRTIGEAKEDSSNLRGRTFDLDGRDAYEFQTEVARSIDDCNVALDVPPGVVIFTVNYMHVGDNVDPCPIALKHAADLIDAVPAAQN